MHLSYNDFMSNFIGRTKELKQLNTLLKKKTASLVLLKGRRRIGKSRLAEEYGRSFSHVWRFTGLPPVDEATASMERDDFAAQLAREVGIVGLKTSDWGDLFWHLANAVNNVSSKKHILIILDEINWMGSKDPTFLGKLKSTWDLHFKKNDNLILLLSGSMSAWIDRNILSHTGFMGRISLEMTLGELPLPVCYEFWGKQAGNVSTYEKFKILSVTGGVPRYLEEIRPELTAEQNIYQWAFNATGFLFHEFERIFSDLFSKRSAIYQTIVEKLAYSSMDFITLSTALHYQKSGVLSTYLDDLVETGYVARDYTWDLKTGKLSRLSHFRLCDNYLRFYLRYILPNKARIEKGRILSTPAWHAIMGLQFENLVMNNFHLLDSALNISSEEVIYNNPFFQKPTKTQRGCQIDYLIQTRFNTLYVCEIKFSTLPITSEVITDVQEKINRLKIPRGFSIRPVLIHVNGVSNAVIESDFFAYILDFTKLQE